MELTDEIPQPRPLCFLIPSFLLVFIAAETGARVADGFLGDTGRGLRRRFDEESSEAISGHKSSWWSAVRVPERCKIYAQYDPLSLSWLLYMHRIGLLDWEWKPRVFPCLSFGGQEYVVVRTTTLLAAGSGGPASSLGKSRVKETPPSSTSTPRPTMSAMS